jgi:hypothetical protein
MARRYDDKSGRHPEVLSDLRTQLERAAQEHRPDREQILARVERGMSEQDLDGRRGHRSRSGPAPWARVVGVTAGLVGAFGIGGLAVGLTVNAGDSQPQTVVTSPGPAAPPDVPTPTVSPTHRPVVPPSGTSGGGSAPATGKASGGASSSASTAPATSPDTKRGNHPQDGYLWSDGSIDSGSNDFWAQSDVTIKNAKPLTALTVELRIVKSDGVASTGSWSTVSSDDYDVTVTEEAGAVVYRWTLKSGRTLPAGTQIFAGQYNHAQGGRDAGGDLYAAQGDGSGGAVEVRGDFY